MFRITIAALLLVMVFSCGENEPVRKDGYSKTAKTPEDSLFQEVMDGHDEAMAKMGRLSGYRKQVEQKLDSVSRLKSRAAAEIKEEYSQVRDKLKSAEDGMNQWMHDFQIDSAQDDVKRRIQYLADEKLKVEKVRDDIFEALAKADSLLKGTK